MKEIAVPSKRLDAYSLEMIIVLALITLHDFFLSNVLSLPLALHRSNLVAVSSLDKIATSLEFLVPIILLIAMIIL
jgi:hypothetical protein